MVLVANQMVAIGHDVMMLLVREKKRTYALDERVHLVQVRCPFHRKPLILLHRLWMIRHYVKTLSPDCVVSFMCDLNVATLCATLGQRVRKIVSERAFPGSSDRGLISRYLENWFYATADAIVYQTETARTYCPSRLVRKSVVIPNIIDMPTIPPYEGKRSNRIVSVGRLADQKNYPLLLGAFSEFLQHFPDFVLEIYGDGPMRDQLTECAGKLGVAENVCFEGYVDNLSQRINDAAMFVLSSDYEGISNAMTEALALGLPVICTDCPVGGAAQVIDDGISGLLVPVGDRDALVKSMLRVASDSLLSKRLSDAARLSVRSYSAEPIGRYWEAVIHG